MSGVKLHSLLGEALEKYHIEYHRYFSNHVSQGLIALFRLGATPQRLQEFYDNYVSTTLDGKVDKAIPSQGLINEGNYEKHLGENQHFLDYVEFFSGEIRRLGTGPAVTKYMKTIHPGECSSAFHPIIQLGYGADVESDRVMAEGLAYICYSYESYFSPRMAKVSQA